MGLYRTRWFDPILDTLPRRPRTTLDTVESPGAILRMVAIPDPFGPKSYAIVIMVETPEGEPLGLIERAVIGLPATQARWKQNEQSGGKRAPRTHDDDGDNEEDEDTA
jgi:hypothetical protein